MTSASRIYLAAWMAAEDALPAESKALLERHDVLHRAWVNSWKSGSGPLPPMPDELKETRERIEGDPLARIPWELRRQSNMARTEELDAERATEVAA